jgi:hypothetical protein
MKTKAYTTILSVGAALLCCATGALAQTPPQGSAPATMSPDTSAAYMTPYFSTIDRPIPKGSMMVMLLSDFQSARYTDNFVTAMGMMQYGACHADVPRVVGRPRAARLRRPRTGDPPNPRETSEQAPSRAGDRFREVWLANVALLVVSV